jgi:glycosyltransferase involved in cell wall biosynthesis
VAENTKELTVRILLVHNFYQIPGGEDKVVREELAMLSRAGLTVDLFSIHNDEIKGTLGSLGAALRVIYNRRSRQALFKKLKEFSPDIVHVHNFFPLLSPSVFDACQDIGVPSIMTLHNFRIFSPGALLHPSENWPGRSLRAPCWPTVPRRVYRNSVAATAAVAAMIEFHKLAGTWTRKVSRFIALSEWAKQRFVEAGLPVDRIVVKPNCVASPPAFDPMRRRQGALFVGRLSEEKGIRILLRAWKQSDYPLKIIGDGPLSDLVEQNVCKSISYLGRQPTDVVQREMQAAKFLVLPSTCPEMFPVSVVEAFSNHLPVICSDLPSMEHLVVAGATGLRFAVNDADALARQVAWASSNGTMLEEMGRRAYATYQASYTEESNIAQLVEIYSGAIKAPDVHQYRRPGVSRPGVVLER